MLSFTINVWSVCLDSTVSVYREIPEDGDIISFNHCLWVVLKPVIGCKQLIVFTYFPVYIYLLYHDGIYIHFSASTGQHYEVDNCFSEIISKPTFGIYTILYDVRLEVSRKQ